MPVSETILPVLIGADMNCYTLARALHEAHGAFPPRLYCARGFLQPETGGF